MQVSSRIKVNTVSYKVLQASYALNVVLIFVLDFILKTLACPQYNKMSNSHWKNLKYICPAVLCGRCINLTQLILSHCKTTLYEGI